MVDVSASLQEAREKPAFLRPSHTYGSKKLGGLNCNASWPGVRDVGNPRSCIFLTLNRITSEPVIKSPPSPSPVEHSWYSHVLIKISAGIWPGWQEGAGMSWPSHMDPMKEWNHPCAHLLWGGGNLTLMSSSNARPTKTRGGTPVGGFIHCLVYYQFLRSHAGTKFRACCRLFN